MTIRALEEEDSRSAETRVAGPAALIVAKVHKISERTGNGRLKDKDALDVLRLLRGTSPQDLAARWHRLQADARSAKVTEQALALLPTLFGRRSADGVAMAIRATEGLVDPDEIAASFTLLTEEVLSLIGK